MFALKLLANWKLIVGGVLVAAVLGFGYAFWSHYKNLVAERDEYLGQLNVAIERLNTSEANHDRTKQSFVEYRDNMELQILNHIEKQKEIKQQFELERVKANELSKLLQKHDIGHLMRQKPKMLESRINRATNSLWNTIEKATSGSSTTIDDRIPESKDPISKAAAHQFITNQMACYNRPKRRNRPRGFTYRGKWRLFIANRIWDFKPEYAVNFAIYKAIKHSVG